MALQKTTSAHSISAALSGWTFIPTSRRSHASGSIAEMVKRPSGGKAERLPSNESAWRKLQ
jgi:hypothetical protein